jgi:adenine-specific DNA-methyltransferase
MRDLCRMQENVARLHVAQPSAAKLVPQLDMGSGGLLSPNLLIHGDNLQALEILALTHAETVQCVYIDPPYNTGHAFAHYADDLGHQAWLDMMAPRISAMRTLMRPGGYFFVSIDEANMAYLKVLSDSIFGRRNFIGNLIWEKKKKPSFLSHLASVTEYILVYARDRSEALPLYHGTTTKGKKYPLNNAGNSIQTLTFPAGRIEFNLPDQEIAPQDMSEGRIHTRLLDTLRIVNGRNAEAFRLEGEWRYSQRKLDEVLVTDDVLRISKIPFRPNHIKVGGEPKKMKNLLSTAHYGLPTYEDAAAESRALFGKIAFDYPKPEGLIHALIGASTQPGDLVLDAFLGSGTTAAVAQKMGRRWIGIEQGPHCMTHCLPRLRQVCAGEEGGGITRQVAWSGGGGFGFFGVE